MEIKDLSWNESITKRFNNPLLPRSIRGIIVGKSGCGKTTLLLNLLVRPGWLDYDNLCVFGKSLFQPEYRILKKAFEENLPKEFILRLFNMRDEIQNSQMPPLLVVQEWAKTIKDKSNVRCNFFETASDVPDPRDLNSEDKNLMIFDDLLLEKQNKCECYYIRGRHSKVDCFYQSQINFKYQDKLLEKMLTLYVFSHKILKTLIPSITIMLVMICQRKNLENFVKSVGKNHMVLLLLT